MSIMKSVRQYIKTCPLLENGKINVDFLEEDTKSYTLDVVPCTEVVKKYVNGITICKYEFVFASRELYGEDIQNQLENCGFYEEIAQWLYENSKRENLPILADGKQAIKIEALSSGFAYGAENKSARYQLQCRLTYLKNK